MNAPVSITALASISPLGFEQGQIANRYQSKEACFSNDGNWKAKLTDEAEKRLDAIRSSNALYRPLDKTVVMALDVSRRAVEQAGWTDDDFGVNFGSSRGATELFESHHSEFLQTGRTPVLASPTTTLGNISSWVAHDLKSAGPEISHSITCSTALHAVLNGMAWINSGMARRFLAGGSEAPLTPFTLAQMRAMKIYSREDGPLACRALDLDKTRNSMILGEGAAAVALESGAVENALAVIAGIGFATESLKHSTSISSDAVCFQKSMKMALGNRPLESVDAIVMHAPGTVAGDVSEYKAIQHVFGERLPAVTTNKWKIGHTFGASGLLSVEMAIEMMRSQQWFGVPFGCFPSPEKIETVMVNAVGFGGNAVSLLLQCHREAR